MDQNNINLGLGFDSKGVDDTTRGLKKQMRVFGGMLKQFGIMRDRLREVQLSEEESYEMGMKWLTGFTKLLRPVNAGLVRMRANLRALIPGFATFEKFVSKVSYIVGMGVGVLLAPFAMLGKFLFTRGVRMIKWATDFNARIEDIVVSATELENRFTRFANLFGSERFAKKINKWQWDMLQNMPILRDDLDDFTVQLRELGLDPRNNDLRGVLGASLGPGHSYSGVMSAVMGAAKDGDTMGLFNQLGRTLSPTAIMESLRGATTQQERFTNLLALLNQKYGENVDRSQRIIATNIGQIKSFWEQFKEELVGTPQEGNLMWYVQQVFVDIKGWLTKNKAVLFKFADSIRRVLGGVGKFMYNMFRGWGEYASTAIGGIQEAAESFKGWALKAEGTLSLWALRVSKVFKQAGVDGLGVWGTMKALWNEFFPDQSPWQAFWDAFKDYGSRAIDWIGEKMASTFGYWIQKGIVGMFDKDNSGEFTSKFVPEFIKQMDINVAARDLYNKENERGVGLAGAVDRANMGKIKGSNPTTRNAKIREQADKFHFKNTPFAGARGANGSWGTPYEPITPNSPKMFSGQGLAGANSDAISAAVMLREATGIDTMQVNSTDRTNSVNHMGGAGVDFQATDELMKKLGVPLDLRDKENWTKWHPILDEGGMRLGYESPTEEGGQGHIHMDVGSPNNKTGAYDRGTAQIGVVNIIVKNEKEAMRQLQQITKDVPSPGRSGENVTITTP